MIKQQKKHTTSSAFFKEKQVPSQSIFHQLIQQAEKISDEVQYRPFKPTDIMQIVNLQKQWFPINYGVYFYNRIFRNEVHCIIAETSITINTQTFIRLVKRERMKEPPLKVHKDQTIKGYFSFQPNIQKNEFLEVKVIVGIVVFEETGSRGYLSESWWKGWVQSQINSYYIMTLGVIQEFRKKGIAKQLIEKTKQSSKTDERIKLIFLHVISYNKAAIRLYEKQGFNLLEDIKQFYNLEGDKYDGKALGIYLKNGKKGSTWGEWFSKLWS